MDYSKLNNIAASIQDVENTASIVENRLNTKIDENIQSLQDAISDIESNSSSSSSSYTHPSTHPASMITYDASTEYESGNVGYAIKALQTAISGVPTYSAGTGIIISNNIISVDTFQLNYDDLFNKPDLDPLIATHADRGVVLSHANQRVYAIGNQSVAYGHSTNADGNYAIAGGSGTRAWGDKSVAFGTDTIAFGDNTIAAGNKSIAVGTESVAFGENAYTKGKASGYFGKGRSVSAYVVDTGVTNSDPWYILTFESSAGSAAEYPDGRGREEFRVLPGMYITEYETDVNSEQPGWLIKNVEYIPQNLGWTCKVYIDDPNEDAPSDPQQLVVRGIVSEGYSYALGRYLFTTNQSEVAVGDYNVSHKSGGSAASGSGTIFSVGTGILSDNSEYLSESMADPEDYLINNQTYRANALEVLTNGSVYIRDVGGYDGKSIANVDSLQTVITDVNTRLSDLEAASSSSSSSSGYIRYTTGKGYALGNSTTADGENSFAEGYQTAAEGDRSHAEGNGYYTYAYVHSAYTAGDTTIILEKKVYPGQYLSRRNNERYDAVKVSDVYSHPSNPGIFEVSLEEGFSADLAYHNYVYIFGGASSYESHAEGQGCSASGWASHAEGTGTTAFGSDAHSEGKETLAYGDCAHSEGKETLAYGNYSHTEGSETNAREGGHSEGNKTYAYGDYSHAEGHQTLAYGNYSHAEGKGYDKTVTVGSNYVAGQTTIDLLSPVTPGQFLAITDNINKYRYGEIVLIKILGCQEDTNNLGHYIVTLQYGMNNAVNSGDTLYIYSVASGSYSHSEGNNTSASGDNSHAEGDHTNALNNAEHAEGKYNKSTVPANSGDPYTMSSIGIGTSETNRLNATEVMSNGDVYIKGIGTYDGTNIGANGVKSVQQVIADLTQQIAALSNN